MSFAVFRTIRMLEEARVRYFIERTRPDSIRLSATMPGQRVEFDIFEDNHMEFRAFQRMRRSTAVQIYWDNFKLCLAWSSDTIMLARARSFRRSQVMPP